MLDWKKGLIIHGKKFDSKELLSYSSEKIVAVDTHPWEREIYRFIITWLSDQPYIVQYSSGTTGKPKEIRLKKTSMMQSALNTCRVLDISQGDTALLCMPVDYIAGKMMIVRGFASDLDLYFTEPKSVPDIHQPADIHLSAMVPLQVLNLLSCLNDLLPLRNLLIGGAPVSHELELLVKEMKTRVFATYGMAETSSHIALKRLNGENPDAAFKALPGIHISIDERGCLVIDSDYLPNQVISNDLVEITGPGSFKWLGRYDNLINSGGIKIVPEEVEALIMSKTMLECIAIGLPHKKLGQHLVLVFEKDQIPDSFHSLQNDFESFLPRRWKPKELMVVDKFPRNDAMKVDRKKLSDMLSAK